MFVLVFLLNSAQQRKWKKKKVKAVKVSEVFFVTLLTSLGENQYSSAEHLLPAALYFR